jgi:site-specific DNA-cytosine methylase
MSKEGLCGALKATDYKQPPQLLELTTGQKQGYRVYDPKGVSATLVGQAGGVGAKTGLYNIGVRVRRLTPVECERLQGFPDGWTEGLSDTQRYKVLGNAVSVPVIKAIVEKLIAWSGKSLAED